MRTPLERRVEKLAGPVPAALHGRVRIGFLGAGGGAEDEVQAHVVVRRGAQVGAARVDGVPGRQLVTGQCLDALGQREKGVVVGLVRRARAVDLVDHHHQLAELGAPVSGTAEREQRLEVKVGLGEQVLHQCRRGRGSSGGRTCAGDAGRGQHRRGASADHPGTQQRAPGVAGSPGRVVVCRQSCTRAISGLVLMVGS
jgi:hypothetical protein